jgi:hypothetical protein
MRAVFNTKNISYKICGYYDIYPYKFHALSGKVSLVIVVTRKEK